MIKNLFFYTLLISAFTSFAQSVNISPANGNRGQSLPVVISGNATNFSTQGSGTAYLYLTQGSYTLGTGGSQSAFSNIQVIDPLTIAAYLNIPAGAPLGNYDLMVWSGTSHVRTNAFSVNPASNSQMTILPDGSQPAKTTSVQVTVPGGSFKKAQTIKNVWLSRNKEIIDDISNVTVVNPTTLSMDINVPSGATNGLWHFNVYTDAGIMYSAQNIFTIDNSFAIFETGNLSLILYPNPATDKLILKGLQHLNGELNVRFTDVTGRSFEGYKLKAADEMTLDISDLAPGIYLMQLYREDVLLKSSKLLVE